MTSEPKEFNVGDLVIWKGYPDMGIGEVLAILSSTTLAVRFESYEEYDDGDNGEGDEYDWNPGWLDFHYVAIKDARHILYKYNPDQAGDTEDDI